MIHVQAKNGFHSLRGIDYCSYAIELAESIACDEQLDIEYKVKLLVLKCWKQNNKSKCNILCVFDLSNEQLNNFSVS